MLKQYKSTVELAGVRHEHSILRYLAQIEFPAPRLHANTNGETLIQHDGKYYVLFDVLEGYFQYHNYFLLPAQAQALIAASGKALGALHVALKDFTPEGYQPNGFTSPTGDRWRELSWYTDKLAWCREEIPQLQTEETRLMQRMFAEHADRLEAMLYDLNNAITVAAPTRLIIHGDYGPYNLFFKHGAPVVILDFELARLDWRLTDLATALPSFVQSRLGFSWRKMTWFLEAYQTYCPMDAAELQLLPAVWQFLTLRRVIVCWYRYCTTHATQWLIEAQHKLKLIDWLIANQQTLANVLKLA